MATIDQAAAPRGYAALPRRGPITRMLEDERWLAAVLLLPTIVLLGLFIAYPFVKGRAACGDRYEGRHPGPISSVSTISRSCGTTAFSISRSTTRFCIRLLRQCSSWPLAFGWRCC